MDGAIKRNSQSGERGTVPRVLFLATFFPRPLNMLLGPWALAQAQALRRHIPDFRVVSLTPWVPKALARTPGRGRTLIRLPNTVSGIWRLPIRAGFSIPFLLSNSGRFQLRRGS